MGRGKVDRYISWMLFVDGENLTARGQAFAQLHSITLSDCSWYKQDVFLWFPDQWARKALEPVMRGTGIQSEARRAFYYATVTGDRDTQMATRQAIWKMGFDAQVFPRVRNQRKAKGVDIALTKDLLANAFLDNYDVAVVITGDADYLPVIEEVKRLGKRVCVAALEASGADISDELRLAADWFISLDFVADVLWRKRQ